MKGVFAIGRWVRDRARTTPGRVAIDHVGRSLTYSELDSRSDRLAAGLVAAGLRRGDRVATLTGNTDDHVVVFFACAKAALVLLPLSWRLAPAEIAYQLDDARPALLLVEEEHDALAHEALASADARPRRMTLAGTEQQALEHAGHIPESRVVDDDPLLLVYTSGTTGKPKGAVLTHANCFWTNLSFDLATGVGHDDVVLQVLPQFHCGGWNVQPLLAWWKGATVVLERGFDAGRCLSLIEEKRVTTMMGVPANYLLMSQEPAFATTDLSSLRSVVVGGAPMPEALLETWQERGVTIVQGYGLTEAAPNVLCLPPEDALRKQGYAGKPYPFVDVALRDAASGEPIEGPGTGELVVRGPNVFAGYWDKPDETAAAFSDGWLLTGDLAERDEEGFYRIAGRVKDMYISGGENVYPAEVEGVLYAHDAVADAAVVGVPDERWGEAGVAFVVLDRTASATAEELRDWCRTRLATFKVPRDIRFVASLPRSGMDKVLKDELVREIEREVIA